LKLLAQKTFKKGFLKLVTADGHVLTNLADSLQTAGVQDGEHLTAVVQEAKVAATDSAFAMWCCGGNRLVTWGHPRIGGDCSAVQGKLCKVQQVQATGAAFSAILVDGSVVTWGMAGVGGDSSLVEDQLRNVLQIQATRSSSAFAAILADGSVVSWGDPDCGGDCSALRDELRHVQQIQATGNSFAAILEDGSVVAWGHPRCGGDCSAVRDCLKYL
jgi:hypothetical protein